MVVRLLVVSDTHLAPGHDAARDNWEAVLHAVAASDADAVVHLGDLTVDGANRPEDLRHARGQLDRLDRPWHAIPGNHDLGDNPAAGAVPDESVVDDERRRRWLETIGPDRWRLDLGGWTLLAFNTQLFGSGLAAEGAQWEWLAAQLADLDPSRSLGLLIHKPLLAPGTELSAAPAYRFVPEGPRSRLLDLLGDRPPQLILSGHVHQHRILDLDGVRHVWAPTTWAALPDSAQPRYGSKRCGHLHLLLGAGPVPSVHLAEAPGLTQQVIGESVASPYHLPHSGTGRTGRTGPPR